MRAGLIAAGAGLAALAFTGWWVEGAGYRRAMAECRAQVQQQERQFEQLRRDLESEWQRQADQLTAKQQEYDDAIAAIDAIGGGDAVCLAGDGLRALRAIR